MWKVGDHVISSRLLLGTSRYPSLEVMREAIEVSGTHVITVSLKREQFGRKEGGPFWDMIKQLSCHVLPNTAGCMNVKDAVNMAYMAREVFGTNWIKLEVIGDTYTLQPDLFGLLEAAKILITDGFEVFPYCTEDLVLCTKLVEAGCRILMPWGSPIGSGKGILNPYAFEVLRHRFPDIPLVLDAGVGRPSHAIQAMEMGVDAVLLNTAVAISKDPVRMASAFATAISAGRMAYEVGVMQERQMAEPSTPLLDTPFWQVEK
jgi:thiazole synthase